MAVMAMRMLDRRDTVCQLEQELADSKAALQRQAEYSAQAWTKIRFQRRDLDEQEQQLEDHLKVSTFP